MPDEHCLNDTIYACGRCIDEANTVASNARRRGYDVATARAESRLRIGWSLARMSGEDIPPNEDDG